MSGVRKAAMSAGFTGWLYSWYLLRGVRNEYSAGDIGQIPTWLLLLLGGTTTVLIAVVVTAGLRSQWWPALALAGGLLIPAGIVAAQWSVMTSAMQTLAQSPSAVGIENALRAALRTRPPFEIVVISGASMVLLLSAVTAVIRRSSVTTPEEAV